MPDDRIDDAGPTIAEAFAALPLESPERSAWPALAARIGATSARRTPVRRGWWFAAAAAAALGAVALLPRNAAEPVPANAITAAPTAQSTTPAPTLDALMAESARLDYLMQAVSGEQVASASATALALEYEARVQRIDVALSDPGLAPDDRTALWSRRVELLREYAGVQGTAQWLTAEGSDIDGDLVAVF